MGAAASAPRQPLRELSADGVRDLVESLGPKFVDLAKQLQENGYDGEVLADASDEDLDELFGELSVSKLQQKVLRNKLRKSLDERPAAAAVDMAGEGLLGVARDLPWIAPVAFLVGAVVKAAQDAAALKEDATRFVRVVRSVEGALQRAAADGKLTENASIREALEEALAHCHMLAREGTCVAMLLSDAATFEALQAKLHSACEACAADTNLLVRESYDQATRLAKEVEALGGAEAVAADPKLRERITASLSAADQGIEVTAVAAPVEYVVEAYDCFLSHKRSDCQDLVARVHDRLTDAGYRVFIDREDLEELPKLKASVRASGKLVFFMSPKIFESDWCMLELCTAVDSGVDVLPVTVEGTTWGNGERVFPDAQIDVPESVEIQGQVYYPRAAAAKAFAHAIGLEHSRSYFDAFIEKLSKRLPAKSADEIEAKFKAQDERAARYDAMEQQLKALTTMMQAVAQIRGDPEAKGGFDADKAVVAQLATPVIYNELTKKMPVPHTEPARLLALDEAGLTGEALEARIANNDEIRGVVAEAMALTGDDVAWVGAVQKDKQTIIRGEFRESAPDAVVDGFTGPREMTQCQHVIASGASRDVRCATSFESDGDVLSMNAPEFTAIGKAGHAFGLIQALGERAMDESVPDAELLHGEELPTTVGGIRKMMGIMMDEDTRYRGVPVKVCGENVCTLCTMGKGEGDVAQLEALAVRAGDILEKQMPRATPVTAQEPDAPATDDVGAWLKARRLGKFAGGLLAMGVECVEDLHDVEPEDCIALGMSHIQQNRLRKELAKLETQL